MACNNTGDDVKRIAPAAGVLVASDSMPVVEDRLNNSYFSVRIETTDKSDSGEYYVEAAWGYNLAHTHITYPAGLEHVKPVIRADSADYKYIIGFYTPNDSGFHEYYSVSAQRGTIQMKYLKTYFFQ